MITRAETGITYKENIILEYYPSSDLQVTNYLRRNSSYNKSAESQDSKRNFLNRKHEWT